MKNKMEDVRNLLIAQMEALSDPDTEVDLERTKQMCEIGKVLVESAKAEVSFIKAIGGDATHHSSFITNKQLNANNHD